MSETWKPVVGFEGHYEVSDAGRVRSVARQLRFKSKTGDWCLRTAQMCLLSPQGINSGYLVAHLYRRNCRVVRTVHSLVAAAFIGPRPLKHDIAHNNGDKKDNRVSNLRYDTRRGNHADKRKHGTNACGSRIAQAVLREKQIPHIRALEGVLSPRATARAFCVSVMTIHRVWRKETWAHV